VSFPSPFSADFWIDRDPSCLKYDHVPSPSNVVQFPGVAKANAAQAAESLEQDRSNMRADLKSDLMRQRREYEQLIASIDDALMELSGG